MATEAGMELPDAALKIGAPGKGQHFQKDFFYRLVVAGRCAPGNNRRGLPSAGRSALRASQPAAAVDCARRQASLPTCSRLIRGDYGVC
jgi:hypothetical protein